MEKDKKNKFSKTFWSMSLVLCLICIFGIGVSFYFYKLETGKEVVKEEFGGNVYLKFVGNTNGLTLLNSAPMTNQLGMIQDGENKYFDFSVEVDLDKANYVEYEIALIKDKAFSNIPDSEVRFYLEEEMSGTFTKIFDPKEFIALSEKSVLGTDVGDMVLYNVKKDVSGTTNYRLRMWLAETSQLLAGNYSVEVLINAEAK